MEMRPIKPVLCDADTEITEITSLPSCLEFPVGLKLAVVGLLLLTYIKRAMGQYYW